MMGLSIAYIYDLAASTFNFLINENENKSR
jgi:hypothetical protein